MRLLYARRFGTRSPATSAAEIGYSLRGEATGRLGWVRGDAAFSLAETETGTEVTSRTSFQTGGAIGGGCFWEERRVYAPGGATATTAGS